MRLKFLSALAHRFGALEFRLPGIALQKKRNQFVTAMGFDEVGHDGSFRFIQGWSIPWQDLSVFLQKSPIKTTGGTRPPVVPCRFPKVRIALSVNP